MRKFVFLASAVILAASSVNCAKSSDAASSLVAPSLVSADAKKPGHGTPTGTLAIVMVDDLNGNGVADFGDSISFDVQTTATNNPQVGLACSKNGINVLSGSWPSTPIMTLYTAAWSTPSEADCTATAYYFDGSKQPVIAQRTWTAGS